MTASSFSMGLRSLLSRRFDAQKEPLRLVLVTHSSTPRSETYIRHSRPMFAEVLPPSTEEVHKLICSMPAKSSPSSYITPILTELHWLPVKYQDCGHHLRGPPQQGAELSGRHHQALCSVTSPALTAICCTRTGPTSS